MKGMEDEPAYYTNSCKATAMFYYIEKYYIYNSIDMCVHVMREILTNDMFITKPSVLYLCIV